MYFDDGFTIYFQEVQTEVVVTLEHEGNELLQERSTPTYTESHPNGPECGPRCLQAELTLEVAGSESH